MRKALAILLLAFAASIAPRLSAQTTASGTNVQYPKGTLLATGQWCFNVTCGAVTNGAFSVSVTAGTQTVTVTNGSTTTYLTLTGVTVGATAFNWNTVTVAVGQTYSGMGLPSLACQLGAAYTQTDSVPANKASTCLAVGGQLVWVQSPPVYVAPSGIYAAAGAPTFSCTAPCAYIQADASPTSSSTWNLVATAGIVSQNWVQQTGSGGGSGTVNPPTAAGQTTYYNTSSASVISNPITYVDTYGDTSYSGSATSPSIAPLISAVQPPYTLVTAVNTGVDIPVTTLHNAMKFTCPANQLYETWVSVKISSANATDGNYFRVNILNDNTGTSPSTPGSQYLQGAFIYYGLLTTSYQQLSVKTFGAQCTSGQSYWFDVAFQSLPGYGTIYLQGAATGSNVMATSPDGSTWTSVNNQSLNYLLTGGTEQGFSCRGDNNDCLVIVNVGSGDAAHLDGVNGFALLATSQGTGDAIDAIAPWGNGIDANSTNKLGINAVSTNNTAGEFSASGTVPAVIIQNLSTGAGETISAGPNFSAEWSNSSGPLFYGRSIGTPLANDSAPLWEIVDQPSSSSFNLTHPALEVYMTPASGYAGTYSREAFAAYADNGSTTISELTSLNPLATNTSGAAGYKFYTQNQQTTSGAYQARFGYGTTDLATLNGTGVWAPFAEHPTDSNCTSGSYVKGDGTGCGTPGASGLTPTVAQSYGDVACAEAADSTVGAIAATAGSSTSSTMTYTLASAKAWFQVGQIVQGQGNTPTGYNGGPFTVSAVSSTNVTVTSTNNPGTMTGLGTLSLYCQNQSTDQISSTQASEFAVNNYTVAANYFSAGIALQAQSLLNFFSSSTAAAIHINQYLGATTVFASQGTYAMTGSEAGANGSFNVSLIGGPSTTLLNVDPVSIAIPTTSTGFANNTAQPATIFTTSQTLATQIYFNATGVASGTYTSGGTIVGTTGQTCTLTGFNDSSTATATVALTGSNVIAGGTALTITARGQAATSAPTTATLGSGTATCSGTATIATVLGGAPGNAIWQRAFVTRQY